MPMNEFELIDNYQYKRGYEDGYAACKSKYQNNLKHGKWLFVIGNCKEEIWMCDQCERCIRTEQMEKDELIKRYPYCHCGAKMDKEKEEWK